MRLTDIACSARSAVGAVWLCAALLQAAAAQPSAGVRFGTPPPGTLSRAANVIYGIEQDADGAVWVASELGLHRYDGVDFQAFRADPERPDAMPGNRVTGVSVAPNGDVWAAVDRFGLVRYDRDTRRFERFRLPVEISRDVTVVVDGQGEVWVSAFGWDPEVDGSAGPVVPSVYRLDAGRRTLERLGTPGWGLRRDADGTLWVVTSDGLVQRTETGWRRHRLGDITVVPGDRMRVLRDGELLVLAPSGRFRRIAVADGVVLDAVRRPLLLDRGGRLWSYSAGGGLEAVDVASGRRVRYQNDRLRPESLPDGLVIRMLEDREGTLWLGTGAGLRTLAPGWDVFQSVPLGPVQFSTFLARGASGRVWTGASCGAVGQLAPDGSLVPLADSEPAAAAALARSGLCASNVLEARDGTFWLAGWPFTGDAARGGVLRVGPGGAAHHSVPVPGDTTALRSAASRGVFEAADGGIWAATEAGLSRWRPGDAWQTFAEAPGGLESSVIWSLADAGSGRLWVGTYSGGLSRLDPRTGRADTWRHDANDPATLPSDAITAIVPSAATPGVVWVGTHDGGLARLTRSRVARIGYAEGMPGLTVKSIVEEPSGVLWVGTDAGLVRYDPGPDSGSGDLRVYTEADGLPGAAFGLYDAARLPDGRLAFATQSDVVTFDPGRTEPFALDAAVALRALRIEGTRRVLPAPGAPIRLQPGERSVGVEVVALSFRAPQRLRYAVWLDGVDDDWVPLGADRSAAWANLRPGRYTMRARAGLASGRWSPRELAVEVIVAPAWWERRAVRGLAALLAAALFALAIRELSQRRLRREVQALEVARRLQSERERISRDLHDHVGAQLSSLLAGVELARLARDRGARPGLGDPLDAVEGDARTTMRQLRETIWALHGQAVSLDGFCDRVRADLAARAPTLATDVACHGDGTSELTPMQALNLYRIVQEAVTNALKHAGASALTVGVRDDGETVTVEIWDDGTFQAAGGDGAPSGLEGFGMRSMTARATALGGTLAVDTAAGTTVRVTVPAEPVELDGAADRVSTSGVPASGVPASGVPASGVPASGVPASGVPASGVPASGVPASGVPASGVPASGVPASGVPASGVPASGETRAGGGGAS